MALRIWRFERAAHRRSGSVLINLELIGGLVSYVSFIRLRIYEPERSRSYHALCIIVLISIIYSGVSSTDFLASVAVIFVLNTVYFFRSVRPRTLSNPLRRSVSYVTTC